LDFFVTGFGVVQLFSFDIQGDTVVAVGGGRFETSLDVVTTEQGLWIVHGLFHLLLIKRSIE
jgi:hypothetical protein